jgi:hypothetical protein
MATVHLKSTPVTNSDATPKVINNSGVAGGIARRTFGVVTNSAADDVGSTYRYCRIPSSAVVKMVKFWSAASGATGQLNVGLYQTAENGGAVVDADLFASAIDPGGGALNAVDITHESGEYTFAESYLPLWQVIGLTADPGRLYDVAATVSEIMADAVSHKLEVEYVV